MLGAEELAADVTFRPRTDTMVTEQQMKKTVRLRPLRRQPLP